MVNKKISFDLEWGAVIFILVIIALSYFTKKIPPSAFAGLVTGALIFGFRIIIKEEK